MADRTTPEDLYEVLNIPRDADPATIKRAHRRKAKQLHPDNGETGDRARFETVQRAFLVLSDPAKREHYDRTGRVEEDRPDNSKGALAIIIVQAFNKAMAEAGDRYQNIDVIARTRVWLTHQQRETEKLAQNAERPLSQARDVLSRLKFRDDGEFDPIGHSVRQQIGAIEDAIARATREAELCAQAIEYLDLYGFDFTPMQTPEPDLTRRVFPTADIRWV